MTDSKRIEIKSAGGYEKLELVRNFPIPTPKPNEVLVEVSYAGLNYADILIRLGVYASAKELVGWPITPGFEVSGRVSAVGSEIDDVNVGDKIVGFTLFNGYSSHVVLRKGNYFPLPEKLTLEQGAAIPAVFMTAYHALFQCLRLRPVNPWILVHSAAGGVGSALVQLASLSGVNVVGIVGSPHKIEHVKKLGAKAVFDKSDANFSWDDIEKQFPHKFDAVYDANGYTTFNISYNLVRSTGKLVVYGAHSLIPNQGGKLNYFKAALGLLKTPKFSPMDLITTNKGVVGFNLSFLFEETDLAQENLAGLIKFIGNPKFQVPTITVYPIEDVAKAHAFIESGKSVGKIVLAF